MHQLHHLHKRHISVDVPLLEQMEKVKRVSVASAQVLEKIILEPIFPISCKCVFRHSCWKFCLYPIVQCASENLPSSAEPLLSQPAWAMNHKTPAGICIRAQHKINKITPSSAHTQATTLTFQDNNQVSLLTHPSLIRHSNL